MKYGVFYTFPDRWVGWNYWYDRSLKGKEHVTIDNCEKAFLEWAKAYFAKTQGMHYIVVHHENEKGL